MPKIAISYRRSDSMAESGRIYDRLARRFGREQVFMDVDQIPIGVDFREHLGKTLAEVSVLLVIVGKSWAGEEGGARRLDDPADWVRLEIETAIQRGIPVVPVLLNDTPMPAVAALPPSLESFAYRQACRVEMGADFRGQMDRLIRAIAPIVGAVGPAEKRLESDAETQEGLEDPPRGERRIAEANGIVVTTQRVAVGAGQRFAISEIENIEHWENPDSGLGTGGFWFSVGMFVVGVWLLSLVLPAFFRDPMYVVSNIVGLLILVFGVICVGAPLFLLISSFLPFDRGYGLRVFLKSPNGKVVKL